MTITIHCDKCRFEVTELRDVSAVRIERYNRQSKEFELCMDCTRAFEEEFLNLNQAK